jgi:hypothetical protein
VAGVTGRPGVLAGAALVAGLACGGAGVATWTDRITEVRLAGLADDGDPTAPSVRYETHDDLWARDSLTTAHSDPPRPDRVSGGVTAEPADTTPGAPTASRAVARSSNLVVAGLQVERAGRFQFDLRVDLTDVEVSGAGRAVAAARAVVQGEDGSPVPNGEVVTLMLEIGPDGRVIIDDDDTDPDLLAPNFSYTRTVTGPRGGLPLDPGRYRLALELALDAEAPARAGAGQLARIGQGAATVGLRP